MHLSLIIITIFFAHPLPGTTHLNVFFYVDGHEEKSTIEI